MLSAFFRHRDEGEAMAAAETLRLEQRPVDRWLGSYSEDHRNATNVLIHWICVPAILWCVIAALWTIPVPAWLGRPGLWAGAAMFAALMFYLKLSRKLGYGMFLAFVLLGLVTEGLYRALGLPVVPVAVDSGRLWTKQLLKKPGVIHFRIGETIPAGLKRDEIEARVHAAINTLND